jgi:hypothetical protein
MAAPGKKTEDGRDDARQIVVNRRVGKLDESAS